MVVITLSNTPRIPILILTLDEKAFQLAGEFDDGALSCCVLWLICWIDDCQPCGEGQEQEDDQPLPPLVAHILVALTTDR